MYTPKSLLINTFKNSPIMFIQRPRIPTVPKKQLIIILPYLRKMSQIVKTRLSTTKTKYMKFCKLSVISQTNNNNNWLRIYFHFKDFVPETLRSSLIYKFSHGSTASYIDTTYRHFKLRVSEHQGVSPWIGKPVRGTLPTSVRDEMPVCDHKVVHEDFKFLGNESKSYLL